MSIRCDDCRYLFSKKRSGCPFCGGPTIQDDRPDADLLSAGYTVAPQGRQRTAPADPFEAMLRAYQEEQQQTQPIPIPSPAAEPSEPKQPQGGVDFFAQFRGGTPSVDIPTVDSAHRSPPQQQPAQRQPTHQPDPYEAELRELERQQRRLERQYRRTALWNRLSSLRWGTVFRVVVFLLVVVTAIGLWKMRYAILNSVLNLAIGILPVVLLVWGIWMLIRSIFR